MKYSFDSEKKTNKRFIIPPFGYLSFLGGILLFISTDISEGDEKSPCENKNPKLKQENFLAKTLHRQNTRRVILLLVGPKLDENSSARIIINSHRDKIIFTLRGYSFSRKIANVLAGLV